MDAEGVWSAEWCELTDEKSKTAKTRIKQILFGRWKKVNKGVRHRELEVCEDERSEMASHGFVTYEVNEELNTVEIAFGEIKRVQLLGEEGVWDSMFQGLQSEQCQK